MRLGCHTYVNKIAELFKLKQFTNVCHGTRNDTGGTQKIGSEQLRKTKKKYKLKKSFTECIRSMDKDE